MDFRIIRVIAVNGLLVVDVDHFNADDSLWFEEEYLWRGREGDKHKRVTNDQGNLLMDDDDVAPVRLKADGDEEQYLPAGREWKLDTARPHMAEGSILSTIRDIHRQRSVERARWQSYTGLKRAADRVQPSEADSAGVAKLLTAFGAMQGQSYDS